MFYKKNIRHYVWFLLLQSICIWTMNRGRSYNVQWSTLDSSVDSYPLLFSSNLSLTRFMKSNPTSIGLNSNGMESAGRISAALSWGSSWNYISNVINIHDPTRDKAFLWLLFLLALSMVGKISRAELSAITKPHSSSRFSVLLLLYSWDCYSSYFGGSQSAFFKDHLDWIHTK